MLQWYLVFFIQILNWNWFSRLYIIDWYYISPSTCPHLELRICIIQICLFSNSQWDNKILGHGPRYYFTSWNFLLKCLAVNENICHIYITCFKSESNVFTFQSMLNNISIIIYLQISLLEISNSIAFGYIHFLLETVGYHSISELH